MPSSPLVSESVYRHPERSAETFGELSRAAHVEGLFQDPLVFYLLCINEFLSVFNLGIPTPPRQGGMTVNTFLELTHNYAEIFRTFKF